jgi:Fe2+ transport system protein FeoA
MSSDRAQADGERHRRCIPLAALSPGERGLLCSHPPSEPIPLRLEEFGFVPGTSLEVVRRAPFGDPVEFDIRGYRICLRRAELIGLCVIPENGNALARARP